MSRLFPVPVSMGLALRFTLGAPGVAPGWGAGICHGSILAWQEDGVPSPGGVPGPSEGTHLLPKSQHSRPGKMAICCPLEPSVSQLCHIGGFWGQDEPVSPAAPVSQPRGLGWLEVRGVTRRCSCKRGLSVHTPSGRGRGGEAGELGSRWTRSCTCTHARCSTHTSHADTFTH